MCSLVDFAFALQENLVEISKDSFNNFKLRVGIAYGSLVCGVIGAKKPIFDIWGDTVNQASRMTSAGIDDHIQVPRHTALVSCLHINSSCFKFLKNTVFRFWLEWDTE